MKFLFPGKNISKCLMLKILPKMLSVNWYVFACRGAVFSKSVFITAGVKLKARSCEQCCMLHYCSRRDSFI